MDEVGNLMRSASIAVLGMEIVNLTIGCYKLEYQGTEI